MSLCLDGERLTFDLPRELEAAEPPEARGAGRDDVRLLVAERATGRLAHHAFGDLPDVLHAGDLIVANSSATVPAAVDLASGGPRYAGIVAHLSTPLPDGDWVVELRSKQPGGATERFAGGRAGEVLPLAGGGRLHLHAPYSEGRLWRAAVEPADVLAYLAAHGRPIRYGYTDRDWPLSAYQSVFARQPGSAEMPSAGRPFTDALLARLAGAGVGLATIVLHTGVASPEADERPYPERFVVPAAAARAVRHTRARGNRVIAVGTTVVRALESALDAGGTVRAAQGWTDVVITPERERLERGRNGRARQASNERRGVRAVDGLLTGFHEPAASHLLMLEAVAGRPLLAASYDAALAGRYLWHEFGDVALYLP